MNRYKKLIKNTALITVGNFASKLLTFFLLPLYTAILTTAEYGVADLMTTTVNLITPFFTLIISEAVMRFALDKECDKKQVLSIGLFVTLLGSVVMLVFSPLIRISSDLKPYYVLFCDGSTYNSFAICKRNREGNGVCFEWGTAHDDLYCI